MTTDDLNFIEPRVAAGALFFDESGTKVLMVEPTYKNYFDIPGGYVENGETPTEAVRREVFEELGIKPPIGRLLVSDWWSDSPENNGKAKLLLVFDGGTLTENEVNSIEFSDGEIKSLIFAGLDELDQKTIPRLANRMRHAARARSHGTTVYLEEGIERTSA